MSKSLYSYDNFCEKSIKYNIENHSTMINFFYFHQFVKLNLRYYFRVCRGMSQTGLSGVRKAFPSKGVLRKEIACFLVT